MKPLDEAHRLQLAAWIAGLSIMEFQLRLFEATLLNAPVPKPGLRLVSDEFGFLIEKDGK